MPPAPCGCTRSTWGSRHAAHRSGYRRAVREHAAVGGIALQLYPLTSVSGVDRAGPLVEVRVSALRRLVLQAPAPVIADALGFHQGTLPGNVVTPAEPGTATPVNAHLPSRQSPERERTHGYVRAPLCGPCNTWHWAGWGYDVRLSKKADMSYLKLCPSRFTGQRSA